jgi:hypothetical protein
MSGPEMESPPALGAEGQHAAVGASAGTAYRKPGRRASARSGSAAPNVVFRAHTGREWSYSGKRGRVLGMLGSGRGITQWDCLPWHTRLGGTIHALRGDGLAIETVREGEFRHARYTLLTPGRLVERER